MSAGLGEREQLVGDTHGNGLPSIVAASHELKSPLALIRQLSLTIEGGDLTDEEQSRMLRQISLTSERGLRLTNDLTKSARLSDVLFELEPINPQQLCEDIIHDLAPLFHAHNRGVKLAKRKHPLLLVANRDLLRRIIVNFSDNALHYAEENTNVEIMIKSLDFGKIIRLGVRDYGPRLTTNALEVLRKRLSNKSLTTIDARPQSSGLGLYISGEFANVMNGKIGIERHRDGSTFYVDLQASRQLSFL